MTANQKALTHGFLDAFGNIGQVYDAPAVRRFQSDAITAPAITSRKGLAVYKRSLRKRFLIEQPERSIGQHSKS